MAKKKTPKNKRWIAIRRNYFNPHPELTRYDPTKGRDVHHNRLYEEGDVIEHPEKPNKWWRIYGGEEAYAKDLAAQLAKEGYTVEDEWTLEQLEAKHSQMMTEKEIKRVRSTHIE